MVQPEKNSTLTLGISTHIQPRLQLVLLWIIIFLIIFLRDPSVFLHPALDVEDGRELFAFFYQNRNPEGLFRRYAGYISLWFNGVGYLSIFLPTKVIPYGSTVAPLMLAIFTYSTFFFSRYRCFVRSDLARALACIILALAPLYSFHHVSNIAYGIWNCLLLLILLSLRPLPSNCIWKFATFGGINLLIWSHPLSFIVAPFFAIWQTKDKSNKLLYLFTLANIVAYQILGVDSGKTFSGMTFGNALNKIILSTGWSLVDSVLFMFRAVFGQAVFHFHGIGHFAYSYKPASSAWYPVILGFAILTFIAFHHAWRDATPSQRFFILSFCYIHFAVTFFSVLARGVSIVEQLNLHMRYSYVQSLLFLLAACCVIDVSSSKWSRLSGIGNQSLTPELPITEAIVINLLFPANLVTSKINGLSLWLYTAILLHYLILNIQMGYFIFTPRNNIVASTSTYSQNPREAAIISDFFAKLDSLERTTFPGQRVKLTAAKQLWPFSVYVQTKAP